MIPLADPARTGDALAAARELLPAWVLWSRSLLPIIVFTVQLSVAVGTVAWLKRSAGSDSGLHWSERARRYVNVRASLQWPAFFVIGTALAVTVFLASPFDALPGRSLALATLAAYFLADHVGVFWIRTRLLGEETSWRQWCREAATRNLLSRSAWLLAFTCFVFADAHPSPIGISLLALTTATLVHHALGRSWELLRVFGLAHILDPKPWIGDPPAGVRFCEIELGEANALAYSHSGVVLVTRRLREILDPPELGAVLRHELGHMDLPRRVPMLSLVDLGPLLCLAWFHPLIGWLGPHDVTLVIGPILLIRAWLGRRSASNERRADEYAIAHCNDPLVYSSALEKLYQANLTPAIWGDLMSHPDLYDRMLATGAKPAFPRPLPTRSQGLLIGCLAPMFAFVLVGIQRWSSPADFDEPAILRALALGGNSAEPLESLAVLHERRGDRGGYDVLHAAAQESESQR